MRTKAEMLQEIARLRKLVNESSQLIENAEGQLDTLSATQFALKVAHEEIKRLKREAADKRPLIG